MSKIYVDSIASKTNASDAMSIGSDGVVTLNNGLAGTGAFPQLVGLFYKNANQTVTSATTTRVTWDATSYDPDSILVESGTKIKPTTTGWYKFEWRLQMSQADMNKGIEQLLKKNGNTQWHDNRPAGNDTDGGGGGPHGAPICFAYAECTTANSDLFDIFINQASGSRVVQGYAQNNWYASQLAVYKLT